MKKTITIQKPGAAGLFLTSVLLILHASTTAQTNWVLLWSDEFSGTQLNADHWTHEYGGGGWGNNEWVYYTANPENIEVSNGTLKITARNEGVGPMQYTSARIITKDNFSFQYGKVEARIKLPLGQGLWPAFWMLGDAISTVGWPSCGEIDIMEHVNNSSNASCAVHWNNNGHVFTGQQYTVDVTAYHTYGAIWTEDEIQCYIDGDIYYTFPIGAANGSLTEFQAPFFLLLNMAIGGNLPGNPDASTPFPATMEVDYVRVYQNQPVGIQQEEESASVRIMQQAGTPNILLQMDVFSPGTYAIYDVSGRIQIKGDITSARQSIDLSAVTNGIYLLQTRNASGESTFRLVKR